MTAVTGASVPAASREEDRVRKRPTFQRRRERRDKGGSGETKAGAAIWSVSKWNEAHKKEGIWLGFKKPD